MTAVLVPAAPVVSDDALIAQLSAEAAFAPLRIERLSSWTSAPPALPSASWICWVDAPDQADAA